MPPPEVPPPRGLGLELTQLLGASFGHHCPSDGFGIPGEMITPGKFREDSKAPFPSVRGFLQKLH